MRAFLLRSSRISAYLGVTLSLIGVQALLLAVKSPLAAEFPRLYHRLCCRILGFRIAAKGAPSERGPTLFVVNHVSYTDITILGALIKGSFVAKSEVARWPLFGVLAKLQRTVFIERRVHRAAAQRSAIASRLASGDGLILFPEGTSGDGNRVLPFKSALFSTAVGEVGGAPVAVQPISLAQVTVLKTPVRCPQANAFSERLIGTMRRECLDWMIVLNERHIRAVVQEWVVHYNRGRPHASLGPGIPDVPSDQLPAVNGHRIPDGHRVVGSSILGGLHHEYRLERMAA